MHLVPVAADPHAAPPTGACLAAVEEEPAAAVAARALAESFELGLAPATLGLALSVGAVGALLGALVTSRVALSAGLGRTLVGAAVIGDLAPLALCLLPVGAATAPALAAVFFVRGIGITGCNVHVTAIRQYVTPTALLGRTNAAYLILVTGVAPVGALLGGWLGGALGLRPTLVVGTLGLLSTALFLILSPVRRARTMPDVSGPAKPRSGR